MNSIPHQESRRKLSRKERRYNPIKSREEIEERLSKLQAQYRLSSDMYDPVTQARVQELKWVLGDEKYISHDG